MLKFFQLFLIVFPILLRAQNPIYPQDYFQSPLDIPLLLSGNFGELRDNHFHSGLDYKTQQKEGLNVYASAEGYVSRIKISQYGYGKVVYITHPNGYTTVYAHIQKFYPTLENYIKKIQYQKENYEIEVFPKPQEIPLKKGEAFAYSGNTGSSGGPHLHFEIRDTDRQIPINPILFGLHIEDHKKPEIQSLYVHPLSNDAQVNQTAVKVQVNLSKDSIGNMIADTVYAYGKIGFSINTFDAQDYSDNRNGIYKLSLKVDGTPYFEHELDQFSFDESKLINLHIDYEHYEKFNSRLQKCFIESSNKLSTYSKNLPNQGYIDIQEGQSYQVEINASDIEGNTTLIQIPVVGLKSKIEFPSKPKKSNYKVLAKETKSIYLDSISILFPRYTFYQDADLNIYKNADGSIQIDEDYIPLSRTYTMSFDVSSLNEDLIKHTYIAKIGKKGYTSYIPSEVKDHKIIGKAKTLGKYNLVQDFKAPTIKPLNFEDNKWISELNVIQVAINDELSGIANFNAYINGKWILMEYNHNTGVLTYDLNDLKIEGTEIKLVINVTDKAQNTKSYSATLNRVSK